MKKLRFLAVCIAAMLAAACSGDKYKSVAGDPLGTAGTAHNLIYELRIGSKSTDPQTALDGNSGLQFREAE